MDKFQSTLFSLLLILSISISACAQKTQSLSQSKLDNNTKAVLQEIENKSEKYNQIAKQIWDLAELGYQEEKSSALLQQTLAAEGFSIEKGVAEIPTAFIASYGSGQPVVAILAEYDALPGISQDASPEQKEIPNKPQSHACGHHLFGTGSTAAAIAVKNWLQKTGTKGTIQLFGTPAEEGGAGKVYLVKAHLFDNVDAVLHWHPSSSNGASARSSLANKSAKFRFYGIASHAAMSPQNGRSALDGVEAMDYMVNMLREHILPESRIHYVITEGGKAPNVVPAFAEVFYYCRHPQMQIVKENFERIVKAAEGAAIGTGTKMEYEVIHGLYNVLPNETLSEIMYKNLQTVGGFKYTEEEEAFAKKIMASYSYKTKATLHSTNTIQPYQVINKGSGGSTDVGDVSWAVPTAGMGAATWVPGTSAHSWQAAAAGATSIGMKGMQIATKTLTLTAIDIFKNPSITKKAKAELNKKRGSNFVYESLLGDRKPPLDYRK